MLFFYIKLQLMRIVIKNKTKFLEYVYWHNISKKRNENKR